MIVASMLVLVGAALPGQASPSDVVARECSLQNADSVRIASVRLQPDSARAEIARCLARSVSERTDSAGTTSIRAAHAVARNYAIAWQDSFLVRQVALFERWSPEQRAMKIAADRLRLAGNNALGRDGAPAAMRFWRSSLRLTTRLDDSAGRAAIFGNIGAGYYRTGALDSADAFFTRSRDLAIAIGDHRSAGNAVGNLASIAQERGDLARARLTYAQASAIRARSGDTRGLAADQNNLGLIAQTRGDLAEARRAFEAALAINLREHRPTVAAVNLTNLANIASLTSDFARADALYRKALAIYRNDASLAAASSVLHNLGLMELRRGDYDAARSALTEALMLADTTGAVADAITIRTELAATFGAMGKLQTALSMLRGTERIVQRARAKPALVAALALARADLAVQLNNLPEAQRQYARAAASSERAGDRAGQLAARQGQGLLLLHREDYASAARVFSVAVHDLSAAGDKRSAALAQLYLGYSLAKQGDSVGGRRELVAAAVELHTLGDLAGEASALSAQGDLTSRAGTPRAAEPLYRRGLERLAGVPAPEIAWQLHAGLGEALRDQGDLADAARELRLAIGDIERMSATFRLEERRSAFLADKWDAFAQLALIERRRGQDGDAFAASERMRARQMLDLVARGRIAHATTTGDSASTREADLRQRISELTRSLERGGTGNESLRGLSLDPRIVNPARDALDSAQKEYAALLDELRESNSSYARMAGGATVSWRDVASRLAADEVLLEYLTTDSSTVVFVVTRDTILTVKLDISRRALNNLIDFSRRMISRPAALSSVALWRPPLRRLGELLIAPVQATGLLTGKQTLIVVPHGELHFLSFQSLLIEPSSDRFLVERFNVTYAPSASLWLRMSGRRANTADDEVLAFAPRTDALPASRREVNAIGQLYGSHATVLTGAAASERAFRTMAPTRSIVHVATFGVLNKHNPLFSFVEFAPEGNDDGRLEVREVFGLTLGARLVVLSACQTALGSGAIADVPPGDDWVGLVQGFLYAGAANVLATLWSVEDQSTSRLMNSFYRELKAGRSESAALAYAQRAALRDPRTAHPFYWAGFVLSGSR